MSAPAAVRRSFALIEALMATPPAGQRSSALAKQVQQEASTTLRDLQSLEGLGYAERNPEQPERWRWPERFTHATPSARAATPAVIETAEQHIPALMVGYLQQLLDESRAQTATLIGIRAALEITQTRRSVIPREVNDWLRAHGAAGAP